MAEGTGPILQAKLTSPKVNGREVDVVLTTETIAWATENKKLDVKVNLCDVLIARFEDTGTSAPDDARTSLIIHFVKHVDKRHHLLSHLNVIFNGTRAVCKQWKDTLNELLASKFPHRPKRLLVFVNPVSGKKSAPKVYHSQAEPLFSVCGVATDVVRTQRAHHTEDVIAEYDLTAVDGLVTVGGDGTYAEAVNGLARRAMAEAHEDENDPDVDIRPLALPVGIIPSGTGDGIIDAANLTKDVTTAVLLIILGGKIPKNVVTVHEGRKLMAYSILLTGTGFFSEVIEKAENNRNLGRIRYAYAMLYGIVKHKTIEAEVDYLPSSTSKEDVPISHQSDFEAGAEASGWLHKNGSFVRVDHFSFRMMQPPKLTRVTLGNGQLWLNFVRPCGRIAHAVYFKNWVTGNPEAANSRIAEEVPVKAYRVRAAGEWRKSPQSRIINVDGEIVRLQEPDFSVRCHKGVSELFSWPLDESELNCAVNSTAGGVSAET